MMTKTLGEILPDEAVGQISDLINAGKTTSADFKVVTRRYREHLLARGVDADYLAYALEYTFQCIKVRD
jgi:hypothetical protein